jgi:drug/metabolite transporter (DMT)-like permease
MANLPDRSPAVVSANPTTEAKTDWLALVAGLVTVTLWGSAFVGIRAAGEGLSPGSIALGRLIVSSAILCAVALVRRESLPVRHDLVPIAVYGVLWLGVYSITLNAAERLVDAGTVAMLINTGPILIAILAGVFLREGFPPRLFLGSAVAFAGCLAIGFATALSATLGALGIFLCIVAALAYASAVVVQKIALARASSFQVTWLGVAAGTIACLPFIPTLASEAPRAGFTAIVWTIYLGVFPTAIGFATWSFALSRGSAGRTGSLNYLIPVVAIVLAWMLLGQVPPWLALAGGAVSVVGVYMSRRRPVVSEATSQAVAPSHRPVQ